MDSFKNKLLIILCIFVVITPFWLVKGFCSETEEVDFDIVSGLAMFSSANYFQASSGYAVGYIELDNHYIYHITFSSPHAVAFSDNIPAVNVPYYDYSSVPSDTTIDLYPTHQYIYFDFSRTTDVTITRTAISSMTGAVNDLVSDVGIDSIWNIFDISINYIVIAVVVALGLFIIFKLIRKLTKGKEGF